MMSGALFRQSGEKASQKWKKAFRAACPEKCAVVSGHIRNMQVSAVYSLPGELYRYVWFAFWDDTAPPLIAFMCNPSTASHLKTDNTVDRLISRAKQMGYGGLVIINVFAYRSREPKRLKELDNPRGRYNRRWIKIVMDTHRSLYKKPPVVIAGWGSIALKQQRDDDIHKALKVMTRGGVKIYALRIANNGQPYHPLYVGDKYQPKPFAYEAALH